MKNRRLFYHVITLMSLALGLSHPAAADKVLLALNIKKDIFKVVDIPLFDFSVIAQGELSAEIKTNQGAYLIREGFLENPIRGSYFYPRYLCLELKGNDSESTFKVETVKALQEIYFESYVRAAELARDFFIHEITGTVQNKIAKGKYEEVIMSSYGTPGEDFIYNQLPSFHNVSISWQGATSPHAVLQAALEEPDKFLTIKVERRGDCDEQAALNRLFLDAEQLRNKSKSRKPDFSGN